MTTPPNEDDTFKALRRQPFDALWKLLLETPIRLWDMEIKNAGWEKEDVIERRKVDLDAEVAEAERKMNKIAKKHAAKVCVRYTSDIEPAPFKSKYQLKKEKQTVEYIQSIYKDPKQ